MDWALYFCNITAGMTFGAFSQFQCHPRPLHSSYRGPGPFRPTTAFQTVLASHSIGNEMAWPRFTVAFEQTGSDHGSRVGEMETVGNTLGSTLGTSVDWSPSSPSPILSYLLHLPTFYTQGAQDPGCWVQEWPCPLPELLCPCSGSICSVCTGLQPLYQVRERLYLLEFNEVCPWPPRFYWRPSSLKALGKCKSTFSHKSRGVSDQSSEDWWAIHQISSNPVGRSRK